MKCSKVRILIPDYISGDIDTKDAFDMEKHLQNCLQCKKELAYYRSYLKEAADIQRVKAPRDFLTRLHQRIDIEKEPVKKPVFERLFAPWKIKIPLEAAGLAAVALVVFFFWKPYETPKMQVSEFAPPVADIKTLDKETASGPEASGIVRAPARKSVAEPKKEKKLALDAAKSTLKDSNRLENQESAISESQARTASKDALKAAAPQAQEESEPVAVAREKIAVFTINLQLPRQESTPANREKYDTDDEKSTLQKTSQSARSAGNYTNGMALSQTRISESIESLTKKMDGSIIETVRHKNAALSYIIVEIPGERYDSFMAELSKMGTVSFVQQRAESVPEKALRIRINIQ